jgi:hypothetical protein
MFFGIQCGMKVCVSFFFSLNGGRERKMNDRKTKICLNCGEIRRMEVFYFTRLKEMEGIMINLG